MVQKSTERSSLLNNAPSASTAKSGRKVSNYSSFKFADVHDPNPRFYFTKCHFWVTLLLLAGMVAMISVSLVIGLPALDAKWELYHKKFPDSHSDV